MIAAVRVDVRNLSHYLGACGLFWLASLEDPEARSWFEDEWFYLDAPSRPGELLERLLSCRVELLPDWCGLSVESSLGPLRLSGPWSDPITLDWWIDVKCTGALPVPNRATFKCWAGNQSPLVMWQDMVAVASKRLRTAPADADLFARHHSGAGSFGFDGGSFTDPVRLGWSPNQLNQKVKVSPGTELLAAFGLQRFRPVTGPARSVSYSAWQTPLSLLSAMAAAVGHGPGGRRLVWCQIPKARNYFVYSWGEEQP